jgi:hypothetical protein
VLGRWVGSSHDKQRAGCLEFVFDDSFVTNSCRLIAKKTGVRQEVLEIRNQPR